MTLQELIDVQDINWIIVCSKWKWAGFIARLLLELIHITDKKNYKEGFHAELMI